MPRLLPLLLHAHAKRLPRGGFVQVRVLGAAKAAARFLAGGGGALLLRAGTPGSGPYRSRRDSGARIRGQFSAPLQGAASFATHSGGCGPMGPPPPAMIRGAAAAAPATCYLWVIDRPEGRCFHQGKGHR